MSGTTITVYVLCFAQLKDHLGREEFSQVLPSGATGRDLLRALGAHSPSVHSLIRICRLAVNYEYASADTRLHNGDEVALIPPVSGG